MINCKLSVIAAVVRFRGAQMVAPLQHLVSDGMTIARTPDRLSIARRPRGPEDANARQFRRTKKSNIAGTLFRLRAG
jgi:hypothetical protein